MNTYAVCPCCSSKLIHHINHHRDYWFCRTCWEEMPVLEINMIEPVDGLKHRQPINSSSFVNLIKPKKAILGIS